MKFLGRKFSNLHIVFLLLIVLLLIWGLNNFVIEGATPMKTTPMKTTPMKTTPMKTTPMKTTTPPPPPPRFDVEQFPTNVIQSLLDKNKYPADKYASLKAVSSKILDHRLQLDKFRSVYTTVDYTDKRITKYNDTNYRPDELKKIKSNDSTKINALDHLIASTGNNKSKIYVAGKRITTLTAVDLSKSTNDLRVTPTINGSSSDFRANMYYLFLYYPPDFPKSQVDLLNEFINFNAITLLN
jgi:hypothetical protein